MEVAKFDEITGWDALPKILAELKEERELRDYLRKKRLTELSDEFDSSIPQTLNELQKVLTIEGGEDPTWSDEDIGYLVRNWKKKPIGEIIDHLKIRTPKAILTKLYDLDLIESEEESRGVPEGIERRELKVDEGNNIPGEVDILGTESAGEENIQDSTKFNDFFPEIREFYSSEGAFLFSPALILCPNCGEKKVIVTASYPSFSLECGNCGFSLEADVEPTSGVKENLDKGKTTFRYSTGDPNVVVAENYSKEEVEEKLGELHKKLYDLKHKYVRLLALNPFSEEAREYFKSLGLSWDEMEEHPVYYLAVEQGGKLLSGDDYYIGNPLEDFVSCELTLLSQLYAMDKFMDNIKERVVNGELSLQEVELKIEEFREYCRKSATDL